MDQYINATHLLDNIDKAINRTMARGSAKYEYDELTRATLGVLKQMVQMEVKQGEVRPVVHAHWIKQFTDWSGNSYARCSKCNIIFVGEEKFCCNCGALMDEPDQED